MENPFVIKSYESKELFCDREEELQLMLRNCVNHSDVTLISQHFLKRHKIGTPSVSRRLAGALCEKGLLNDDITLEGTAYSVSDVFLSRWLERL